MPVIPMDTKAAGLTEAFGKAENAAPLNFYKSKLSKKEIYKHI